jgi:hypothetical protein
VHRLKPYVVFSPHFKFAASWFPWSENRYTDLIHRIRVELLDCVAWLAWFACVTAISAAGTAAMALKQISSLRQEMQALTDKLWRRALLDQAVGTRIFIVPGGVASQ